MPSVRGQIEDAVVGLLRPPAIPYLRACRPYNGEIHSREGEDAIRNALLGQVPSVLVSTGDAKFKDVDVRRRRAIKSLAIELFMVSGNMRSREDRTRADSEIYQLAEDVEKLLVGANLGVDTVHTVSPAAERVLIQEADFCVWNVRYEADVLVALTDPDANAPALTSLRQRAQPPLEDQILAQGTGDAFAYASGVVTLTDAGASFLGGYAGARIVITGATTPANNGTFTVTSVPSPTTIRWQNPNAVAEAFAGTWKVIPQPLITGDTSL